MSRKFREHKKVAVGMKLFASGARPLASCTTDESFKPGFQCCLQRPHRGAHLPTAAKPAAMDIVETRSLPSTLLPLLPSLCQGLHRLG